MGNSKINELLKDKNRLLILVPIVLAALFGIVFFSSKSKQAETVEKNDMVAMLEPSSDEEVLPENKSDAYEKDRQADDLSRRQEEKSQIVRGSDFYWDMIDKDEELSEKEKRKIERMRSSDPYSSAVEEYGYEGNEEGSASARMQQQLAMTEELEYLRKLQKQTEKEEIIKRQMEQESRMQQQMLENIYRANGVRVLPQDSTITEVEVKEIVEEDIVEDENNSVFLMGDDGKRRRRQQMKTPGLENLIKACVHGEQTIVTGSTVRLRLLEPLQMGGGVKIPANTIVYGSATLGSSRLKVVVQNIRHGNYICPVSFVLYDNDALEGLNLPNNMKAEAAKRMEQGLLQGIQLPISSIGTMTSEITSALNTVTQVTKQILNMSLSQVKVHLKANYEVYIQEETKQAKERRLAVEAELDDFYQKLERQTNDPEQTNPLRSLIDKL